MRQFDQHLWTFQSTRFVPHCFAGDKLAAETPVILSDGKGELPHHDAAYVEGVEPVAEPDLVPQPLPRGAQ